MAARNSRGINAKGRSTRTAPFAGIPKAVMEHPDYKNLPYTAKALLFELIYQYNGHNNGNLAAALTIMKARGAFTSPPTLSAAIKALLDSGLIIKTREGRFINPGGRCALYALSWRPVDECQGKHDHQPTTTAPRRF